MRDESVTCSLCDHQRNGACLHKGEINSPTEKSCENFVLRQFFWCDKSSAWLDTIICTARQIKGFEGCESCKQGDMVSYARKMNSRKDNTKRTRVTHTI